MELLGLLDGSTAIVRVVDDYIAISTNKCVDCPAWSIVSHVLISVWVRRKCIAYFLQRIHSCFGSYGGGVNAAKTRYFGSIDSLYVHVTGVMRCDVIELELISTLRLKAMVNEFSSGGAIHL